VLQLLKPSGVYSSGASQPSDASSRLSALMDGVIRHVAVGETQNLTNATGTVRGQATTMISMRQRNDGGPQSGGQCEDCAA